MSGTKKVLFVVPYPLRRAPSQRFRVELFLPYLSHHNIEHRIASFLDDATFSVLYSKASFIRKGLGVLKGFLKRFWLLLFQVPKYDYIFIHRESCPIGPPVFEFVVGKIFKKKIIYDFDDAIWIPDSTNRLLNWLKAFWKTKWICKWAYKVVGGNEFLCNYAKHYNKNVILIPTCVDTEQQHNTLKDQSEQPLTIGWTGSHSTLKYLEPIIPVLKRIGEEFNIRVLIICNKQPPFEFSGLQFVKWNESTEVQDLLQIHIGIMPLMEDSWSEGKCGFKLIQYLALGIPAIASPVGVNKQIIEQGANGFLCNNPEQWSDALTALIEDASVRAKLGAAGRKTIISQYSLQVYKNSFLALFS